MTEHPCPSWGKAPTQPAVRAGSVVGAGQQLGALSVETLRGQQRVLLSLPSVHQEGDWHRKGNGCSVISTECGAVSEHVTHRHLRMEKSFWQGEKGATCASVCS